MYFISFARSCARTFTIFCFNRYSVVVVVVVVKKTAQLKMGQPVVNEDKDQSESNGVCVCVRQIAAIAATAAATTTNG